MILSKRPERKGAVLITVMVVIVVLLLIGYQYLNLMLAEGNASIVSGRLAQARHLADSGVHFANFVLAFPQTQNLSDSADSYRAWYGNIYDNSDIFHYRPVNGPNGVKGYFSIVSPRDPLDTSNNTGYRFGVEDEGGKINLNAIRQLIKKDTTGSVKKFITTMIQSIPNIDPDVATAVINWTQEGGTPDSGESAYYSSLGYQSKAGPYDSTDELLMVKGWTPKMLYGNDKNRNGKLDPDEDDGSGQVDLGYQRYFTVFSRELNVDSTGAPRINLANKTVADLKTQLDAVFTPEITSFILLACASSNGPVSPIQLIKDVSDPRNPPPPLPQGFSYVNNTLTVTDITKVQSKLDFKKTNITLWDFINNGIAFQVPVRGRPVPQPIYSPIKSTMDKDTLRTTLTLLFDKCSTTSDFEIPARININTCPADVLTAMGITETVVESLLQYRPTPDMDPSLIPYYKTPAWLVTEAGVDINILKQFANYITTYSQVYRFQVVGYYEFRGPQVRLEVVVDANNGRPRILYWRDLTDLGKGYNFSANRGGP
ncbi:MAG TPA: type II secretion system protein GspK [Gemmatales bacterium]|nr:type II secretion system protein GspK [Gemmatales bacterium]